MDDDLPLTTAPLFGSSYPSPSLRTVLEKGTFIFKESNLRVICNVALGGTET